MLNHTYLVMLKSSLYMVEYGQNQILNCSERIFIIVINLILKREIGK